MDNKLVLDGSIDCFMIPFREFVTQDGEEYNDELFPVAEDDFFEKLTDFTQSPTGIYFYL
jgi:hypothetical protein